VQVSGGFWIFNPLAVTKASQTHSTEDGNEGKYNILFSRRCSGVHNKSFLYYFYHRILF
jgi:hypothetical protein